VCVCVLSRHYALWARLGDLNYLSDADDARPEDYRISRRVIHPDYRPPSVYHDIALFRLERDVRLSAYVRPVCLNADRSLDVKHALATGWGQIEYGQFPARLRHRKIIYKPKLTYIWFTNRVHASSVDGFSFRV